MIGRLRGILIHRQPPWAKAGACEPEVRAGPSAHAPCAWAGERA